MAYLWNGAGEGRGGAGSGRGSQRNGLSGVPQGWLLLILDLLSLSHPSIPFLPRRTLCRFRRGNTLYCGFCTHYYWAHPLTPCVSSMPVYRQIYSTCASGAPILNLLDNQEIARPFLTYDPHLPHGAMHTLWVGYASTHEWLSGHHIYPRIYESNYQLAFCHARHSLHILLHSRAHFAKTSIERIER